MKALRKPYVVTAVVGALVLTAACGSSKKHNAAPSPTPAGPQTYTVQVDANRADLNLPVTETVTAYYPHALSVHPGDTVSFALNDSGEPHTAVFGSLVDAAVTAFNKLPPAQQQNPPVAVQNLVHKIPDLFPQGPGDVRQVASQPCFQATGAPPAEKACAVHTGEFTGTESLASTGWFDPNAPFPFKISDSATPGTFHFYCQVHDLGMQGSLTIAPKATQIPSPTDVAATATQELQADTAKLQAAATAAAGAPVKHAAAGAFVQTFQQGQVDAFGPAQIHIAVGGSVVWTIFGDHSIFFNSTAADQGARSAAPDGSVHFNAKSATPVGGPGAGPKPGLLNGGSWNGVGQHSSGLFLSFPPDLYSYKLTFTKAGTYSFQCTIHNNMKGTVTVG